LLLPIFIGLMAVIAETFKKFLPYKRNVFIEFNFVYLYNKTQKTLDIAL